MHFATFSSKNEGLASKTYKVCDRLTVSVLFTVYDSLDLIKLLELYNLILVVWMWQLRDQKVLEERSTTSVLMKIFVLRYSLSRSTASATLSESKHVLVEGQPQVTTTMEMSGALTGST